MSALALQSFGFEGHEVRAMEIAGAPWFVAQDVCACLEIANHRDAVAKLDDDEKGVGNTDALGRDSLPNGQAMLIVSESGLYSLIFRSRKAAAIRFRKWVTSEVLPTLRRTGQYVMPSANDDTEMDLPLEAPDDIERFKVKLSLVREARHVYGRQTARTIWEQVGLPDVRSQRVVQTHYTPDELDPAVQKWMAERTVLHPQAKVESSELYADYMEWCAANGYSPMSQRIFGEMLTRFGLRPKRNSRVFRLGVRLKD